MNITITGRHIEVTPALEEHAHEGIDKLKKFFDGILDVQLVLSVVKSAHLAEVNILADGIHLHGEGKTDDMYSSIDVALSRIQTQILKYKEKIRNHRLRKRQVESFADLSMQMDVISGEDLSMGNAEPRVIHSRNIALKPMSVDEAVMQMDLIHRDVLVFRNDETNRLNVLCRRRDGDYELIAPEL